MKLYKVVTTRKPSKEVIVEDVLCQKHWNGVKGLDCFQSDRFYNVKVTELNPAEFKCQDCK